LLIVFAVWQIVPLLLTPLARDKIQAALGQEFPGMEVELGRLGYNFPYGLSLHNLRITSSQSPDLKLLTVDTLEVDLAHLPLGGRPLVIKNLVLEQPVVHLQRTAEGYFAGLKATSRPAQPPEARLPLEIRHLRIKQGQFTLIARADQPDKRLYVSGLNLDGSATIPMGDDLAGLKAKLNLSDSSVLLPGATGALEHVRMAAAAIHENGKLNVSIDRFDATERRNLLALRNVKASHDPAGGGWRLDAPDGRMALTDERGALPGTLAKALQKARVTGTVALSVSAWGSLANRDPLENWELELRPDNVNVQPRSFPLPIRQIGSGVIHLSRQRGSVRDLQASYGDDRLRITGARLDPALLAGGQVSVVDIDSVFEFGGKPQPYPKVLHQTLAALGPLGAFRLGGRLLVDARSEAEIWDYQFLLSCDQARLHVGPRRTPLGPMLCDVSITPQRIEVLADASKGRRGFKADALGGQVEARGYIDLSAGQAPQYRGQLQWRNLELRTLMMAATRSGTAPSKLGGALTGELNLSGTTGASALQAMRGEGKLRVSNGYLWEVPVIAHILRGIPLAREALTAGEAAAVFTVDQGAVHVKRAAVSAPVIGLQGSGSIGFDGGLNLDVVIAPLSDWKKKIQETRIPLLSAVVGQIAGQVQKLVNTATGVLLYQVRVSGNVKDPSVVPVPVPVLSDSAATIFGHMLRGGSDLLEELTR
jgi:hypothetical protein